MTVPLRASPGPSLGHARECMNEETSCLLEQLSRAIDDALWSSEEIITLMTALESQIGDFRISVDLLLPNSEALKVIQNDAESAGYDERFLRPVKIER